MDVQQPSLVCGRAKTHSCRPHK